MRCPHLKAHSEKKSCNEMEKAGMPAEISEFDYEHFCNRNPGNCYYYRKAETEKTETRQLK